MIQSVSNVMSGFLVSFIENWKITLVMMASAPVLGIVQGVADKVILSPLTLKIRFFHSNFMTKYHRGRVFVRADQSVALCPVLTFPFSSRPAETLRSKIYSCMLMARVACDAVQGMNCCFQSSSSLSLLIGSLSNFDDDHNDDFKNTIGLMIQTKALYVHHAF